MQIAQKMGGYSLGSADLLRRAMGKKIRSEMDAQRKTFTDGAEARGIPPAKATEVFDMMAKFADYGFNKSHAAAYALVAYQTAWMKANHPAVFIASCMSLALGNTEKLAAYRQEADRCGIRILPPDINRSGADFTVERLPAENGQKGALAIRYALAGIKKVGHAAMQALAATRAQSPFEDVSDFAARIDPRQISKMQIENLIRAGAFDRLEANRRKLFTGAELILRRAQADAEQKESGQIALFAGGNRPEEIRFSDTPDWPHSERLGFEAEAIGFHLTAHPLDAYAPALRNLGAITTGQLEGRARAGAARVKLAGTVLAIKERTTRTGTRMAWVRISDSAGSLEITVFSEVLLRSREILKVGAHVLFTADLKMEGDALRITASDVVPLERAMAAAGGGMRIWLRQVAPDIAGNIAIDRRLLAREGAGRGKITLIPMLDEAQSVEIHLPGGFNVTPLLAQALKTVPGVERVEEHVLPQPRKGATSAAFDPPRLTPPAFRGVRGRAPALLLVRQPLAAL